MCVLVYVWTLITNRVDCERSEAVRLCFAAFTSDDTALRQSIHTQMPKFHIHMCKSAYMFAFSILCFFLFFVSRAPPRGEVQDFGEVGLNFRFDFPKKL